jgi:hypothetical protein
VEDQQRCPARAGCGIARCLFCFVGIIGVAVALPCWPGWSEVEPRRRRAIVDVLMGDHE